MNVYLVINEWTMQDDHGIWIVAYDTYEKAKAELNQWIEDEKAEYWTQVFDDNGNLDENYTIDEGDDYWEIYENGYYNTNSSKLSIQMKEVM